MLRDGKLVQIDSRDLACGDVVRLTEGQTIPADVRIIERTSFASNDFALTGESILRVSLRTHLKPKCPWVIETTWHLWAQRLQSVKRWEWWLPPG